ncbi:MAG: hydroxymethylglutaryl-CoA lyase [Bacillota bacterium]|nr:hydroxymethylglutaryl-CoA lyase [Bacillota bacterium]
MEYPKSVKIREVCTRDGFQNERNFIDTDKKIEIINLLSECGFADIQYTAFVHPKAVPNLKDAEEVTEKINRIPGLTYSALVANKKGLERAVAAGVKNVEFAISATDSHNLNNVNATTKESLQRIEECLKEDYDCVISPGAAVAFGCPFEGRVPFERIKWLFQHYVDWGLTEVSIADTTGMSDPIHVYNTISRLLDLFPNLELALHLHNTRGMALANIFAGIKAGAKIIDTAAAGLGGCPYAPGATGNVATEDVIHMLDLMGVETGVNLDKVIVAAKRIREVVGHSDSYILKAGKSYDLSNEAPKKQCN